MSRSRPLARAALLLAAVLLSHRAAATTVLPLSPAEVDARAARIVVGRCVSAANVETVPGAHFPATEYVFEVEQVLKDDGRLAALVAHSEGRFTFRQVGGRRPDGSVFSVPGVPRFEPGRRYRVALHGDSRLGLTSPVGLGQGVVALDAGAEARP